MGTVRGIGISALGLACLGGPPAPAAQGPYREAYRPQFHFTARQWSHRLLEPGRREEGWLNAPNGMIYVNGEYHLFAQRWMHAWIHAVSKDLVRWEELKPAFWNDDRFGGTQSGTVVVDSLNVSGLAAGRNPVMIAFWSSEDNRSQCISYSNDFGRTWSKYAKNPVLVHPERDPKVFWHAPTRKWVMVLWGGPGYNFFVSDDLLSWTKPSVSPGYFECPDLFELAVDGNRAEKRWVLMNGDGSYNVGGFDGRAFSPATARRRLDWGANFYATQSFHQAPGGDIRRVQMAWMRADGPQIYPGMPFSQQMTFPAELTLRRHADTLRLFRRPAREIQALHASTADLSGRTLAEGASLTLDDKASPLRILAVVSLAPDAEGVLTVRSTPVRFSGSSLSVDGSEGRYARPLARLSLEVLVDRTSIEAFGNDGEISISNCFVAAGNAVTLRAARGTLALDSLKVHTLASIWPDSVPQGFATNLPGPWTAVGGTWKDKATGKVGSGAGDVFALSPCRGGDFTYEGEIAVLDGPAGALAFRMSDDATRGYVVNVDMAGYVKLWAPGRGELMRHDRPLRRNQPYRLKVAALGARIRVYFNQGEQPILDFHDPMPVTAERFGVSLHNRRAVFQDLEVPDLPGPTRMAPARREGAPTGSSLTGARTVLGREVAPSVSRAGRRRPHGP